MDTIRSCILGVLMVVALGFCLVTGAEATEKQQETGMSFTYGNKVPENQLKEGAFFDLLVAQGQEQVLETDLTNLTNQDLTINVSVSNATTTGAGVIDYGPSQDQHTANLTHGLTDILEAPASIKLPKNGKTTLKMTLKIPAESIKGVVLGGIHLQQEVDQMKPLKDSVSVTNQYAYIFSVSIRETEDIPAFVFESAGATVDPNNKSIVNVNVSNQVPRIIKGMIVETLVTPKNSEEVLAEQRLENAKMAPNSMMSIPLEVALASGDYQMKTIVKVGGESWQWVDDFTIEEKKGQNQVLEVRQEVKTSKVNWFGILVLAGVLILGTGILYTVTIKN